MFNRLIIGLFCLILIILPITQASAAKKKRKCAAGSRFRCVSVGGTKVCSCWKTGSEICETQISGLEVPAGCVPGFNCPVITCSVFGTEDMGDGMCDPNTPDPDCGIEGISYCMSPTSKLEKQEITLDSVLTETNDIRTCVPLQINWFGFGPVKFLSKGCTKTAELNPEDCPDCCKNPASDFLTFTATKFNGVVCVCPGGYSMNGACCADSKRSDGNYCANYGQEICVAQQCTADLTRYTPGSSLPYSCTLLPDIEQE